MAGQRRSSAQRRCRATSRKDSNKLRYHHYDDNRLKPMQQHMRTMIARIVLVVIILLLCFLMHPPRIWNSRAVADNTICNDADSGTDESCVISNDDAATDKGNNRVPQECTLVMAPSGIKNSGWGVFTLTPRKRGEMVTDPGDIIIHIPDPNPHHALKMKRLIWDYLWEGHEAGGHYEGLRVFSASSGFGALANGVGSKGFNLIHNYPSVDNAGLKRGESPGAGAISHHHNFTWTTTKNLDAGTEILVEFGANWFRERGFEDIVPKSFSVSHLREVGYCLDNLLPGLSVIEGAGRGAFASRALEKDSIVAPVPLIALSRSSLQMEYSKQGGTSFERTQLLLNYCFGHHANSSLLLYPYSHGINFINHDSKSPNVRLQWWEGSAAYFNKPILELQQSSTSQLMLELVATRPIKKGEEIVLNYGREWENAWNDHVESWQPRSEDIIHISAEAMNNDEEQHSVLQTQQEFQAKPYPENVFTSCYYRYSDYLLGKTSDGPVPINPPADPNSATKRSIAKWAPGMISSRNLRPCSVVQRGKDTGDSYLYTVQIMNRQTLDEVERIPNGQIHFATHVPRHAIVFSDKIYMSDQHLGNAFRKEIGLGDLFPEQWKDLCDAIGA